MSRLRFGHWPIRNRAKYTAKTSTKKVCAHAMKENKRMYFKHTYTHKHTHTHARAYKIIMHMPTPLLATGHRIPVHYSIPLRKQGALTEWTNVFFFFSDVRRSMKINYVQMTQADCRVRSEMDACAKQLAACPIPLCKWLIERPPLSTPNLGVLI